MEYCDIFTVIKRLLSRRSVAAVKPLL